jgi:uncharacterized protein (TIGR03435 family)
MSKVALAIAIVSLALAQTPEPAQRSEFEVASVKATGTTDGSLSVDFLPGGGFSARNLTVQQLLRNVYQVEDYQISGGPPWMNSAGFDIQARAAAGSPEPTREQVRKMIQALLANRFHLALHRETRELPMYALLVARNGPKLQEANDSARPGKTMLGQIVTRKMSLATLASILTFDLKRPVKNETGLQGDFAFTLEWTPGMGEPETRPTLFAAVQEQLGLRLESTRGPIEVFVIDHVERPSQN